MMDDSGRQLARGTFAELYCSTIPMFACFTACIFTLLHTKNVVNSQSAHYTWYT